MHGTVLAADLGGTKISAALVSKQGKILRRIACAVDHSSTDAPINQIVALAKELGGANVRQLAAAGVAVPGLVRKTGTVWAPNLPAWEKVPLARMLGRKLRLPVAVESDRNAAVLGEVWRGAARGKSDVVVLAVGTGIGAGILSGGRLLRGAHELSGCAGWMAVSEADGDEIRRYGGLEALASGPALARAAAHAVEAGFGGKLSTLPPETITAETIAALARDREPFAGQIFQRTGKLLGLAVANFISLFDPEVVVLSGGLCAAAGLVLDTLKEAALARCQ